MRPGHFEALRPVCPVCRPADAGGDPLRLAHIEREEGGHILEGALHCSNVNCLREFPIIDGIPIIVVNIRHYITDQILAIYGRSDLSDFTESILGDCCGPNSGFDQTRQHLSSYAWDHYGDLDPAEPNGSDEPGSVARILRTGCDLAGVRRESASPNGVKPVALDLGCSVGRSTFELAAMTGGLVVGVDLHFAKLRVAAGVLRDGKVRYPRRETGLVYRRHEFAVKLPAAEAVDFWACDAAALPFAPATFGTAAALNLLDCVASPRDLLVSLGRVMKPDAKAVLACPYDWSPTATAVESWLGGHSQRGKPGGSPEAILRDLLTPEAHPGSINTLRLVAEREDLPWHVRLHDRSTMKYRVHLVVAERN